MGPTDAMGMASASPLEDGSYFVRESAAPTGWLPIDTLTWGGSAQPYVGTATVAGAMTTVDAGGLPRFVNEAANPPLPSDCGRGLKVLLHRFAQCRSAVTG